MGLKTDGAWRTAPDETITECTGCGCAVPWSNEMCGSCLSEARAGDRR